MAQKSGEYLEDFGITVADRAVMEFLYPAHMLSVPEIAQLYKVSRQHVQVTVNSLIELDLVISKKNPKHKRSVLILLNDEGRDLFKKIKAREKKEVDLLFTNVSTSHLKHTRQTLETLLKNLS
jgi:DNA-binding MarR family transcriptional regulator